MNTTSDHSFENRDTFGPKKEKVRGGGGEKIPNLFSAPNIRTTEKDVTRDNGKEGKGSKYESDKKLIKSVGRKI